MGVHPRTKQAVLQFLIEPDYRGIPISAEEIAEQTMFSARHIWRTLIELRKQGLFSSSRPRGCHKLVYQVDIQRARDQGLL